MFLGLGATVSAMHYNFNYSGYNSTDSENERERSKKISESDSISLKYRYNKKEGVDEVNYYINIYFAVKNLLKKSRLYNKDRLKDQLIGNIVNFVFPDEKKTDFDVDKINLFFSNGEDAYKLQRSINRRGLENFNITESDLEEFKKDIKKFVEAQIKYIEDEWRLSRDREMLEKDEYTFIDYYINFKIRNCEVKIECLEDKLKNVSSEVEVEKLKERIKSHNLKKEDLKSLKKELEEAKFKSVQLKKSKFYEDYEQFKDIIVSNVVSLEKFKIRYNNFVKKLDGIKLEDIKNLTKDLVYDKNLMCDGSNVEYLIRGK